MQAIELDYERAIYVLRVSSDMVGMAVNDVKQNTISIENKKDTTEGDAKE